VCVCVCVCACVHVCMCACVCPACFLSLFQTGLATTPLSGSPQADACTCVAQQVLTVWVAAAPLSGLWGSLPFMGVYFL
jgi:hypothetical protein